MEERVLGLMDARIVAEYIVYGHTIDEIKSSAKMIGRRFFGSLEPTYTFDCELVKGMDGLCKAQVTAEWDPEIHG
jgi:hypothetical protein